MAVFYGVRVQSVKDNHLSCQVTELYGDDYDLVSSRTLALGFLWDTVNWFWWTRQMQGGEALAIEEAQVRAGSTPLGRALPHDLYDDAWAVANVGRFISCVGVIERRTVVSEGEEWSCYYEGTAIPQATYNIAVTDPCWLEHLAPGMVWESRVWDCDKYLVCKPEWRTSDVELLAKRIDEAQDFSGTPILADALQEAGCDYDDLLNHLRDPNATHVRGCWALDLVLGK